MYIGPTIRTYFQPLQTRFGTDINTYRQPRQTRFHGYSVPLTRIRMVSAHSLAVFHTYSCVSVMYTDTPPFFRAFDGKGGGSCAAQQECRPHGSHRPEVHRGCEQQGSEAVPDLGHCKCGHLASFIEVLPQLHVLCSIGCGLQ